MIPLDGHSGLAKTRRVLVVDDDEYIRAIVALALADEGYEVVTVPDGEAALSALSGPDPWRPHAILLDVHMPRMDGRAFAAAYRRLPGEHAPIIVFTAAGDAPGHARELGAAGAVGKPFDLDDLSQLIDMHTRMRWDGAPQTAGDREGATPRPLAAGGAAAAADPARCIDCGTPLGSRSRRGRVVRCRLCAARASFRYEIERTRSPRAQQAS